MEGKLTYWKTLTAEETNGIFRVMLDTNDAFISVNQSPIRHLPYGLPSKAE
jgi:hypothetical protein